MKLIKKIIAMLLCLSMIMNIVISTAVAEESTPSEGLEFSLNEDGVSYSVTGIGTCTDKNIIIPASYNNLPVTYIADNAFDGKAILSVIMPDTITGMGHSVFNYCQQLTSVTISSALREWGEYIFYGCKNLTSVNIPYGVTYLPAGIFLHCTILSNVDIPETVSVIGPSAFAHTSISTITIPDGVECIDISTFYESALTTIVLPDSVKTIGDSAFFKCNLTNITMSKNITDIGVQAFAYCDNLASIELPEGLKTIGNHAFWACYKLNNVVIPDSLEVLPNAVFRDCYSLTNIDLGEGVTSLGASLFWQCTSLTELVIPESVTTIQSTIFRETSAINTVYVYNPSVSIYDASNTLGTSGKTTIYGYTGSTAEAYANKYDFTFVALAPHVHSFGDWTVTTAPTCTVAGEQTRTCSCGEQETSIVEAPGHNMINGICTVCGYIAESYGSQGLEFTLNEDFVSYSVTGIGTCTDTNIVIPSTYEGLPVTSIGDEAFSGCESLTSVTIPDSVTSIGNDSFFSCRALMSVTIPDSITSIGQRAFYRCALTSITIPASATSIGLRAFGYCENVESIIVDENNPVYHSSDNCLIETESKTLIQGCKTSVIPTDGSVTKIGQYAFHTCKFTSITIPDTILNIEKSAFSSCHNLTSITIPASVTSIGVQAFNGCSVLVSIDVDENNPVYHSSNNCLIETESKTMMQGCSTSVIPADGSVTRIAAYAFQAINGLESIIIPETISSIERNTFYLCYSLKSITIPNSVTNIETRAFDGCNRFTDVYYNGTEAEWAAITIEDNNDPLLNATIHFLEEETTVEITVNNVGSETSGAVITAPEGGWVIGNNTFTITCDKVCFAVVSYDNGATYTRIIATAAGEAHSFTAEITDASTIISVVVAGDTNGDGAISNADGTRLSAAYAGKVDIDALQSIAADVNGDGEITNADITKLRAAYAEKTQLTW